MLFQSKFDQFSYEEFYAFIRGLMQDYNFWFIRFIPATNLQIFSDQQLVQAAPYHNTSHPDSFIGQWKKNEDKVRRVGFRFKTLEGSLDIEMTVDLDNRTISLESAVGISPEQVKDVLYSSFSHISDIKHPKTDANAERNSRMFDENELTRTAHYLFTEPVQRAIVKRRYQIFICSTSMDLRNERQAAVEAILGPAQ